MSRHIQYRKHIRLRGWDYRNPGLYFITICTKNREHLFGEIRNGVMGLTEPGCLAWEYWYSLPDHHPNAAPDAFIVMPDHIHGILGILPQHRRDVAGNIPADVAHETDNFNRMSAISPKSGSVSTIIRSFKSAITRWSRQNGYPDFAWQSRFYDHIIRDDRSYRNICRYILDNPVMWNGDSRDHKSGGADQVHDDGVRYIGNRK